MDNETFFVVELAIEPGQLGDLRSVAQEMVNLARKNEPGTLDYQYFLTQDQTVCHIYERYTDPAAVLQHSTSFPRGLGERGQAFRPVRLSAYGNVTDAIREQRIDPIRQAIPGFAPLFLHPLAGFAR